MKHKNELWLVYYVLKKDVKILQTDAAALQ